MPEETSKYAVPPHGNLIGSTFFSAAEDIKQSGIATTVRNSMLYTSMATMTITGFWTIFPKRANCMSRY
jgi:hypothetical protein